jgi:Xaa-Pro aminopeptidase
MTERMDHLRAELQRQGLAALLVSKPPNTRYLCGATGTACELLVTGDDALLFSGFVDITQNAETAADVTHLRRTDGLADVAAAAKERGLKCIGIEAHYLPHAAYEAYRAAMPEAELVATGGIVEQLRWVKDAREIALIRRGMEINDRGIQYVREHAREGMTEFALAAGVERTMREAGADRLAFLLIQFGENAAKPHHTHSQRALTRGDLILCDIGAVCDGYGSDTTRTFVFGEASDRQRHIYETVRIAQAAARDAVRAGVAAAEVHEASRMVIAEAGFDAYYGHGVGHGINEGPSLGPRSAQFLGAGNVVTIEPGIYIPGWGGVRIEDTVVVTADGHINLAGSPKEFTIIDPG